MRYTNFCCFNSRCEIHHFCRFSPSIRSLSNLRWACLYSNQSLIMNKYSDATEISNSCTRLCKICWKCLLLCIWTALTVSPCSQSSSHTKYTFLNEKSSKNKNCTKISRNNTSFYCMEHLLKKSASNVCNCLHSTYWLIG